MRLWLALSLSLVSTSAFAQHHGGGGGGGGHAPTTSNTSTGATSGGGGGNGSVVRGTGAANGPVNFSYDRSRNAAAETARARAIAGDCKGALDFFDEALRHSIDVTLYRDRGECHEKLGDIYPAIDDYRAYVTQAPDAADVEKIRARLDALVKDASQDMAPNLGRGGDFESEMRGGMTDGSTPEGKPKSANVKPDEDKTETLPAEEGKSLNAIEYDESRDKQAEHGALRKGRGVVIGVLPWSRYVFNDYAYQFGQGVVARIGYSINDTSTFALEIGFMGQLSTGSASSLNGFTGTFNYEYRIALDRWADNQIFFGPGAGYENLTQNTLQLSYSSFVARGRFGYRHVFGATLALDVAADGGFMLSAPINAPAGSEGSAPGGFVGGVVGLSLGL